MECTPHVSFRWTVPSDQEFEPSLQYMEPSSGTCSRWDQIQVLVVQCWGHDSAPVRWVHRRWLQRALPNSPHQLSYTESYWLPNTLSLSNSEFYHRTHLAGVVFLLACSFLIAISAHTLLDVPRAYGACDNAISRTQVDC